MPLLPVDRMPLPSLRNYFIFSIFMLASSLFYVYQLLSTEEINLSSNYALIQFLKFSRNESSNESFFDKAFVLFYALIKEPWCLITLINMAYCSSVIVGKIIQQIVFGNLRVIEQQHTKDKFWNFLFYKFIFIFGVMNVQEVDEIILWFFWFSVLGFLHILTSISKDRFEYYSFSPMVPASSHIKVVSLLNFLNIASICLMIFSVYVWIYYCSINTFAFLAAESLLLIIKSTYVLVRYFIYLWDNCYEGNWENRSILIYYSDFYFEILALFIDFVHHIHMLLWGNIFLSMASLVICLQLRYLIHELQRRLKRHHNYRLVVKIMQTKFPMAETNDLEKNNDECAICWEVMQSARKLPCGHLFHNACLRSWMEQDTSCPTCRLSLMQIDTSNNSQLSRNIVTNSMQPIAQHDFIQAEVPVNRMINHFHFDGSRYVSWLPSFSVEVTHMNLLGPSREHQIQTSILDNMVRMVQDIFPNVPVSIIIDDLRITKSVESTIENIIEGRLSIPQFYMLNHSNILMNDALSSSTLIMPSNQNQLTLDEDRYQFKNNITNLQNVRNSSDNDSNDLSSNIQTNTTCLNENENRQYINAEKRFHFSKYSSERQSILTQRKEQLILTARRRYLKKNLEENSSNENQIKTSSSLNEEGSSV